MKLGMEYLAKAEAAAAEPEEPEPPEEAVKVEMYPSTIESFRKSAGRLRVTWEDPPTADVFAALAAKVEEVPAASEAPEPSGFSPTAPLPATVGAAMSQI